jgi:hypothetical protein
VNQMLITENNVTIVETEVVLHLPGGADPLGGFVSPVKTRTAGVA